MSAGIVLRSCLFAAVQLLITPPFSVIALLTFPFHPFTRYRIIRYWTRFVLWALKVICGINFRVTGAEHLPPGPCVVLSKHQSAWETMAFQLIFPPQVYVIKRELLWIPFFGWGLALMSPIAIDRGKGMRALRQMAERGAARLAQGFWIVVFPEGTRVAPGKRGNYRIGGAWLAVRTGTPVVPVSHNAGFFWGRNAFVKRPGEIRVVVGAPLLPQGKTPEALTAEVEQWIEAQAESMGTPA